jgi:predicted RNA-binding Zn-ribbon protein involved in translation (DUF1610 family)
MSTTAAEDPPAKIWEASEKEARTLAPIRGETLAAALSVQDVIRHTKLIAEILENVLIKGEHYGGSYPGDKRSTLHKPGADKIALTFQLAPSYQVTEKDLGNCHREYFIRCLLTSVSGRIVGEGLGSCSTYEVKYRYRYAKRRCPQCGAEAIKKSGPTSRTPNGYWCAQDQGGCGANFPPAFHKIEDQVIGKIENPDPADQWNTVLKMAKKRAFVDAVITATACSDIFVQDLEDLERQIDEEGLANQAGAGEEPQAGAGDGKPAATASTKPAAPTPPAAVKPAAPATAPATPPAAKLPAWEAKPPGKPAAPPATTPPAKPAQPAAATPPATPAASTSKAADPALKDAERSPGKADCDQQFYRLEKYIGHPASLKIWHKFTIAAFRFSGLKEAADNCDQIVKALGDGRGRETIGNLCAMHGAPNFERGVVPFLQALTSAANGEAAAIDPKPAPSAGQPPPAGDDEPPL